MSPATELNFRGQSSSDNRIDPRTKKHDDSFPSDPFLVTGHYKLGGSWTIGCQDYTQAFRLFSHWRKRKHEELSAIDVFHRINVARKVDKLIVFWSCSGEILRP